MLPLLLTLTAQAQVAVSEAISTFNAHADFPLPTLTTAQEVNLSAGEVVKMLEQGAGEGAWRATGMLLSPLPRDAIWLACQDPHYSFVDRATEKRLAKTGDRSTWYAHLDLPRPMADRHWAVDVWNNHDLVGATGGMAWEHAWRLNPDGVAMVRPLVEAGEVGALTTKQLDEAVYTPVNNGAWVAIALSESQTLLVYHAATEVGGRIPERLVAEFTLSGMEKLLQRIEARAADGIQAHYTGDHAPLVGGDGTPLPLY
ncbi:MAG: hypothetical protein ACI8RZ_003589 [Myxococcota bacterium]|jgi:hypothetical protein